MTSSEITYVIPPYLLNTSIGQELHQELFWLDPELASKNFFPCGFSDFRFRLPKDLSKDPHSFCDDEYINDLIKEKLREKFSVLGILGNSPPEELSDEYLYELYEIFKDRLIPSRTNSQDAYGKEPSSNQRLSNISANIGSGSLPMSSVSVEPHGKAKGSVFKVPRYGEFIYKLDHQEVKSCLETFPLDSLISWARDRKEHKYSFFPYLMVENTNYFLSSLPMYWTPLSADNYLTALDESFGLESDIKNGLSVLSLQLLKKNTLTLGSAADRNRFYNFISNNEILERTGVFYYEVHVEQTATESTNFEPLIEASDSSLSSVSALSLNLGFAKRNIKFDKIPQRTEPRSAPMLRIDLKEIQSDICLQQLNLPGRTFDDDTLAFLGAEPGVTFEGSIAVGFNNSCSYSSVKNTHVNLSSLNLNRRFSQLNRHSTADQEISKLEINAPFHTYSLFGSKGEKCYKTDTIGFGVNFIERSLFITLNGVMVKVIREQDLTSSNKYQDSIFGQGEELGPLFPILGFRLADLSDYKVTDDMPKSKIVTNFGLKSFKFNINSYVQSFKLDQKKLLKSVVADEINNQTGTDLNNAGVNKFEKAIRNIQDDPAILNDFIKGYLIQEGFLGTLDSFKSDLEDLAKNISQNEDDDMEEEGIHPLDQNLLPSKAPQRQQLKLSILERRFNDSINILRNEFPDLQKLELFVFELELLQYIEVLQRFFQLKFESIEVQSKNHDTLMILFEEAAALGRTLIQKSGEDSNETIAELSGVFLLNNKSDLKELSQASRLFERHANDVKVLASLINSEILEAQNFNKESRLENMVISVGENINRLSSENKNPFRLLNFETDFMDA